MGYSREKRTHCKLCGTELKQAPVGRKRKFCSDECQRQWWMDNREEAGKVYTYTCQNCGKEYQTLYSNRETCCSRECGWELRAKRALVEKQCLSCGQVFKANSSGSDYCSDECRKQGIEQVCQVCGATFYGRGNAVYCSRECELETGRRKYEEYMIEKVGDRLYICQECGKEFTAPYGDKRREFCSTKCSRRNYRNSPAGKAAHARQRHTRRALKYGNGSVQAIDPNAVFERDGWRCGICGEKVNPRFEFPHPMSATLDHIIPLARGGTHTWGNVQLAHFICNVHKSDIGGGQLRLGITVDIEVSERRARLT